jgi:hypothetical protein
MYERIKSPQLYRLSYRPFGSRVCAAASIVPSVYHVSAAGPS